MTLTTQKDRVPEEAKKMITVELTGTEKQIAYARSILVSAITRAINEKFVARLIQTAVINRDKNLITIVMQ